jgi:hypothetical protein
MSIICQTLLQIFKESLSILLQILHIMTPVFYYMDTDCIEDRKQKMKIFSIYRSWEPYDVIQKHCLVDCIDKENVQDFSYCGIYLQHSSVYAVFNFIYITSA